MKKTLLFFALVLMGLSMMAQTTYTKVTSLSELNAGDKVLLVGYDNDGQAFVMSYQKSNNRHAVAIAVNDDAIVTDVATDPNNQTDPYEITLGQDGGNWTFFDEVKGGYLYAAGGGNYLKTQSALDEKGKWNMAVGEDGIGFVPTSIGGVEQNIMRYNVTSTLFGCYKESSNVNGLVYIFKAGGGSIIYPEPSNYPEIFYATVNGDGITLHWTDATGEQLPQKYLVVASPGAIEVPVDGEPVPNNDLAYNVNYGVQHVTFVYLAGGEAYHFAIFPYTNSGANIDYKTDGTYPVCGATMPMTYDLFFEGFNEDLGAFTTYNVEGEQEWVWATHNDNTYAYMNGYADGSAHANEDWLISPNIEMAENINLEFSTAMKFNGNPLRVMVSVNYEIGMAPEEAAWADITGLFAYSTGNYEWVESGLVDITENILGLGGADSFCVAFVYTSTDENASSWEIDYVRIASVMLDVEENEAVKFDLYPNPANDNINIVAEKDAQVQIIDMTGRMVMAVNVVEGENAINVSDLNAGIYFVRMNGAVVKFVKR